MKIRSVYAEHELLQNELHARKFTHLFVRLQEINLVIFSIENGQESDRAQLVPAPAGLYLLSVANHRGQWQQTPFTGSPQQLLEVLETKMAFSLSRWQ